MLAGTYLAEYGRIRGSPIVVRFINDILLSAPSIIIGLFVYEIAGRADGPFLGARRRAWRWRSSSFRSSSARPRTCCSSCPTAARGGAALGMPRVADHPAVAYSAARAGLITGVLLAVARVSGETAPLLFTALNNQFSSIDLMRRWRACRP